MLHKYGMKNRGFSIGCQPLRELIMYEPDRTGKYYDILIYGRKLTEREVSDYELEEIEER